MIPLDPATGVSHHNSMPAHSVTTPHPSSTHTPDDDVVISMYAAQKKIYPRSVIGTFTRWRWVFVYLTQIIFYGLPWLQWSARQAVLFDLEVRRFYVFGLVLYPQDFIYLAGLLILSALALFLFTAVAGRLWCGYSCPQTVYTEIFLWIERQFEGDRAARMRLDTSNWSLEKVLRKGGKQLTWIALGLWTGYTFVGYFVPIRQLGQELLSGTVGTWESFWMLFYGLATYGNAGYLREQVCKYMCPYARFQSAMFDSDTLTVTYDSQRGEPRGARSYKADHQMLNLGSCIDCRLCVQVCPTDIDIRKGLQYECIGCGACADACNIVMDNMGYARGLIKYSTQHGISQKWSRKQIIKHIFRPRVLIYSTIFLAVVLTLLTSLLLRMPFKVDVVRDRSTLNRIVAGGAIENVYRLQLMNATEVPQTLRIDVTGLPGLSITSENVAHVEPTQSRWIAVRVHLPYAATASIAPGSHPIAFTIEGPGLKHPIMEKSVFLLAR